MRGPTPFAHRPPFVDPALGPHDWETSYVGARPIGHAKDPGSWHVRPGARAMLHTYIAMTKYWNFDEKSVKFSWT